MAEGDKMSHRLKKNLALAVAVLASISGLGFGQGTANALQSTDGSTVNLETLRGKIVVLSFGGTWVPLTARELPALQKLADRNAARGVQVYWVSINSDKQGARNYISNTDLQAFVQKNGLRAPVLRDPEQRLYKELGLDALPTVVILDRQGKVVRKHVGFGTDAGEAYGEIQRELDQLLK